MTKYGSGTPIILYLTGASSPDDSEEIYYRTEEITSHYRYLIEHIIKGTS